MPCLFYSIFLALFILLSRPTSSSAVQSNLTNSTCSSAFHLIFQFPDLHLENLAVRSNGHLIITVVSEPLVYDLDPKASDPSPTLLHRFPNVQGMAGIVETAPDIFAVIGGNESIALTGVPGSFLIWSIDLNTPEPTVKLITSVPEASALNGLTRLQPSSDIILAADSTLGAVWRVNIVTGDYSIAIQNSLFAPTSTDPRGINGVHTLRGMLYFTNTAQLSYGRVSITDSGSAAGEVEILARGALYDDFDLDWQDNAWIATHPNSLIEVTMGGKQRNITADCNSTELLQPSSAKFGRGSILDKRVLYVVGYGSLTVGGQVVAVNTGPFGYTRGIRR